jgi:DNA-binding PadR family transcriptional regulator
MRHNAMVPKGFIRYHVLEALNEKSMSGSELMDQIEKQTEGAWKPSPGSIYPLLAWLQDNGYITELPPENGLKRYELTQNGKALLEDQRKIRNKVREEGGFFAEPFFERLPMRFPPERERDIRISMRRFASATFKLSNRLRESFNAQALDDAIAAIDEASTKLEQIHSNLKGEPKHEPN